MARVRHDILVLGASFGSLLGMKLALAGHRVHLVGLPAEAFAIRERGLRVSMPVRGRDTALELDSRSAPGVLSASGPDGVTPDHYDLVALVIQEPHYSLPGVRELVGRIAESRRPCLAVMNVPPPPFLERIPGVDAEKVVDCYTEPSVWGSFDPALMTLCSADPQAVRPRPEEPNVLRVVLASNFKLAPFESEDHTGILRDLERDVDAIRLDPGGGAVDVPVKLRVQGSVFAPLAKWSMLLAGNYRCVTGRGIRSIRDAVYDDIDLTRRIYDWVNDLCVEIGASPADLVPFDRYRQAAEVLVEPASVARALLGGAKRVERADCLIRSIGLQFGRRLEEVDHVVATVDRALDANRERG
jgi:hypothetical protein